MKFRMAKCQVLWKEAGMGIGPEGFGGCKHKDFAEAFLLWTKSEGMKDAKLIPKGCYAAIRPLAFTHAIVVGVIGDFESLKGRWCYKDYTKAKAALDAWDGQGEPTGWHRHPDTGRRVAQKDGETDGVGRPVKKGDVYVML
jgi:hypothetical protein